MKKKFVMLVGALVLLHTQVVKAEDIPAGPIWNRTHALTVCPPVCQGVGKEWNGHWTTIAPRKSVCGCVAMATPEEEQTIVPTLEKPTPAPATPNPEAPFQVITPAQDRCVEACKIKRGPTFTGHTVQIRAGKFTKCVCHRDPSMVGNKN